MHLTRSYRALTLGAVISHVDKAEAVIYSEVALE